MRISDWSSDVCSSDLFRDDLMPLNQFRNMASTFAMLGAGTGAQPFRSVRDYDNWLARAARIPALFDQAIANMREGVAQGLVQPRVLIEKTIPQFDARIDANPAKTIFWKTIEKDRKSVAWGKKVSVR